jgi:hypothetical protein
MRVFVWVDPRVLHRQRRRLRLLMGEEVGVMVGQEEVRRWVWTGVVSPAW